MTVAYVRVWACLWNHNVYMEDNLRLGLQLLNPCQAIKVLLTIDMHKNTQRPLCIAAGDRNRGPDWGQQSDCFCILRHRTGFKKHLVTTTHFGSDLSIMSFWFLIDVNTDKLIECLGVGSVWLSGSVSSCELHTTTTIKMVSLFWSVSNVCRSSDDQAWANNCSNKKQGRLL